MTSVTDYTQRLSEELATLTAQLEAIAVLHKDSGDWVPVLDSETVGSADENEVADSTEEWNERQALMAQLEIRYRNITRALTKIEQGTFGICEISGTPIEPERLDVNPAARTNLANIDREKELPL